MGTHAGTPKTERHGSQRDERGCGLLRREDDDKINEEQFIEAARQNKEIVERALANPLDNFEQAMKPKVEGLMIDRMDQNREIVNLNDSAFQSAAFKEIARRVNEQMREAAHALLPHRGDWRGAQEGRA